MALTDAQQANLGMGNNPFLGQDNPYLQGVIDKAGGDVVRNYNLTTQPAFNKAMVQSGSFGNEGVAQMNSEAQRQMQDTLANQSNAFRSQDYGNQQNMYQWQQNLLNNQSQFGQNLGENQRQFNLGFGRNTFNDAYSQNMQNMQTGMGLLGAMGGYTQNDINSATAQQNAPMDYWKQFSNSANSLGQGYGTNTSVQGSTSNPFAQMMGGAQLGSSAYDWWNKQNAGGGYAANPASGSTTGYATSPAWNSWATGTGGMGD